MKRLFRNGVGRFTAPMMTEASLAGDLVRRRGAALQALADRYSRARTPPAWLLGEITGSTEIPSTVNRWEYSWRQVGIDENLALSVVTNGLDDEGAGTALNLCELVNDGSGTEGPGWNLATAPVGFEIQPIAECVVQLWPWRLDDGSLRFVFFASNVLDGECPE